MRVVQDLKKRKLKVPESEYKEGPNGLKCVPGQPPVLPPEAALNTMHRRYYDVEVGKGALAKEGERVVVHYEARWKGITFMTSRVGPGVTGGTPLGFDVGAVGAGGTLPGLDLVRAGRCRSTRPEHRAAVAPELGASAGRSRHARGRAAQAACAARARVRLPGLR